MNRKKRKEHSEKKQLEIEHLKASGLQDKALYGYTFDKDNGMNPEMKLAHNYVNNWAKNEIKLLRSSTLGDVGTGKSFFAGCIANALLVKRSASSYDEFLSYSEYTYRDAL